MSRIRFLYMLLRYLYIIFLGILLAIFVGVGVAAFYKAPEMPKYIVPMGMPVPAGDKTQGNQDYGRQQEEYQKKMDQYQADDKMYNRNVSIIVLVFAVIYGAASLLLLQGFPVLSDGFLLGGLITLLYSIVRGFSSDDSMFRFLVVSVSLLVVLFVGYDKFIKPLEASTKKKK